MAKLEPRFSAKSLKDALKCPMIKIKNVRSADNDGEENDEKRMATAVKIVSSRKIR